MNKRKAKLKKCYGFTQTKAGYFVFEQSFLTEKVVILLRYTRKL